MRLFRNNLFSFLSRNQTKFVVLCKLTHKNLKGEIISPDFVVPEFRNRYRIHRIDYLSRRYYFIRSKPHISFTSLCDELIPKGIGYDMWLMNKGIMAEYERDWKAAFGSLFHKYAMGIALKKIVIDFDELKSRSRKQGCKIKFQELFPPRFREEALTKIYPFEVGLSSWMHFLTERVGKIYAVEYPLKSMKYATAGQLDFVCEVFFNKKYVPAIIDLKSNFFTFESGKKKEYQKSNLLQLELQRDAWNDHWGDVCKIDHVFNWSPVKYKETPSYQFENHTKNEFYNNMETVFNYARLFNLDKPKTSVLSLHGKVQDPYKYDYSLHTKKIKL